MHLLIIPNVKFQRLQLLTQSQKLTIPTENIIDINSHDTNKCTENHEFEKRSLDDPNLNNQNPTVEEITVKQLEKQVDDLVSNYNKLAQTLNQPQLHEINAMDGPKTVCTFIQTSLKTCVFLILICRKHFLRRKV